MITIAQGQYIGIATSPDLGDMTLGKAWTELRLNTKDRVRIVPHTDGSDRWVFRDHNIFIVIPTRPIFAKL